VINQIVSCGCSFLYGIGCYEQNHTLGKLMAKKLNAEHIDLSLCGGSNDRIIRKIIDWAIENKNQLKNTFFLIGITDISRYESWDELLQRYAQGDAREADVPNNMSDLHRIAEDQLLTKVKRMYYKYLHSNKSDLDRTLRNIILLTSFFEKHGSKYIIFNSMGDLKKMSKGHRFFNEVFNNKNYYSDEAWYESLFPKGRGMISAEDKRMEELNMGINYKEDWGHPSEKSHKLWFEKLYKYGEEIGLWNTK
tara:strand:+ start:176 stop:925 length:750 start_codon:yes stop_codon:yes gene_type:complete